MSTRSDARLARLQRTSLLMYSGALKRTARLMASLGRASTSTSAAAAPAARIAGLGAKCTRAWYVLPTRRWTLTFVTCAGGQ